MPVFVPCALGYFPLVNWGHAWAANNSWAISGRLKGKPKLVSCYHSWELQAKIQWVRNLGPRRNECKRDSRPVWLYKQ